MHAVISIRCRTPWFGHRVDTVRGETGYTMTPTAGIIDWDSGLMFVGDNADLYQRMLRKFLDTYPGVALEIATYLSAGDNASAQRSAHSIKGTAATLGMNILSAAAASLEESLRSHLPAEESRERLDLFAQSLDLTLQAIRGRLGDSVQA